ncbi:neuropeptide receptor npr-1-like [Centruroides vittatus]|uniref:neuropeptide receptor npr-1-like n=1 Tax=Centruroides vittatus TaxID=120091 RepID=UPI00350EA5A8
MLSYLQGMAVTAGTLSLTILSLYRYTFLRYPNLYKKISGNFLLAVMIISVWTIASLISLPMVFTRTMQELHLGSIHMKFCIEQWNSDVNRRAFSIVTLIIVYVLPCTVLIVCHSGVSSTLCTTEKSSFLNRNNSRQKSFRCKSSCSFDVPPTPPNTIANSYHSDIYHSSLQMSDRQAHCKTSDRNQKRNAGLKSRRKLANLLMGMTSCFVICWLPYNITSFYVDLYPSPSLVVFLPFTLLLGHAHSAINPIIYWFMNRDVRLKVKNAFNNKTLANKFPTKTHPICLNFGHSNEFTSDSVLGIFHPKYTLKEFTMK